MQRSTGGQNPTKEEKATQRIQQYFSRLVSGCGDGQCNNVNCKSCPQFRHSGINRNTAAGVSFQLFQNKAALCNVKEDKSKNLLPSSNGLINHEIESDDLETDDGGREAGGVDPMIVDEVDENPFHTCLGSDQTGGASARPTTTTRYSGNNLLSERHRSLQSLPGRSGATSAGASGTYDSSLLDYLRWDQPSNRDQHRDSDEDHNDDHATGGGAGGNYSFMADLNEEPRRNIREQFTTALLANLLYPGGSGAAPVTSTANSASSKSSFGGVDSGAGSRSKSSFGGADSGAGSRPKSRRKIADHVPTRPVDTLSSSQLIRVINECKSKDQWAPLIRLLGQVFSSAESLARSFLPEQPSRAKQEEEEGGEVCEKADVEDSEKFKGSDEASTAETPDCTVDVERLRCAMSALFSSDTDKSFYEPLIQAVETLCRNSLLPEIRRRSRLSPVELVNVFVILFELPILLDPFNFERILPRVCNATSLLPMELQASLCRVWSRTKVADSPSQLSTLQQTLMQLITIRCLTTEWTRHNYPNEDEVIKGASLTLRIVYYASLLAGKVDSVSLRSREAVANAEFEADLRASYARSQVVHHMSRRPQEPHRCDPLGTALGVTANDCRHPLIPPADFVNDTLNENIKIEYDYICYKAANNERSRMSEDSKLSFMELPFLLFTEMKIVHLYFDNRMRMLEERREAILQTLFEDNLHMPYFKLRIARDRVVEDALLALEIASQENPVDLKKQLYIEFEGEQGIDEGGVSKEFFQLVVEKIFNPDYGMFVYDELQHTFWFNPAPMEDMDREYSLIGIVLGLAIYNHVILDVRFPSVLYRKLLGKLGTFEDLKDSHTLLAQGLQSLLDYEGDDLEEVFAFNFHIDYRDTFGASLSHELIPDGANTPVTKDNRREFVDLYADFLLNSSIKHQFQAFRRGFEMVIDESPLKILFRPAEVELLVCGSQEYNFADLEKVTVYDGDYTPESQVIRHFWSVVHAMTDSQKRQLLEFTTGTDRVPLGGMSKMKFVIARQGPDTDRLPTAHTCFNVLLLPEYSSREKLERLLQKAITNSKGFGML